MNHDLYQIHQTLSHIKRHYLLALNNYDQNFVCDVIYLLERGRELSQRQRDHVGLICDRIRRAEQAYEQDQT